jgi:MFS family permease
MSQKFKIPKNVKYLGFVSFLNDVASEIIYPLLPVFLSVYIGVGTTFIGLVEGIAESTASLLKLFSGWFSDKIKKRKLLAVIGYSISSVIRPFIAISSAGWHIITLRFLDRVGKGIRTSPRDALISESTPPEHIGRAFGFHRSLDHLGAIVGPIITFGLLSIFNNDLRSVFLFASIPGAFVIIFISVFVKEKAPAKEIKPLPKLSFKIFDKNFKSFLYAVGLFTLGNSSDAFLLLRAKSSGIAIELLPILWIVLHIVKFSSSYPAGILSDRIGRKPTIITGWLIYAIVYLSFGFVDQSYQVWILFAVYGLFYGLTEGVEKAFISDMIPPEIKGTAFGVYNFVIGIFALPASLLFGLLWDSMGASFAFFTGALLAFVSMIILAVFVTEKKVDYASTK